METVRLNVVIHAEEEFDWDGGFHRGNTKVSHHKELIEFVDKLLDMGVKVTLAMDYPFVMSEGGQEVIERYKHLANTTVEFAAHLHPWVNPPFEEETVNGYVSERDSFAGNLSENLEYRKIAILSRAIENLVGVRPITYLAGRYGIGDNTAKTLIKLGFNIDLSISALCDYSDKSGPDFRGFDSGFFIKEEIYYIPHSCSIVCVFDWLQLFFNRNYKFYNLLIRYKLGRFILKILRAKSYRLTPEGCTYKDMKSLTLSLRDNGKDDLLLSFHSPTLKPGATPYTNNEMDVKNFMTNTCSYLKYLNDNFEVEYILPVEVLKVKI